MRLCVGSSREQGRRSPLLTGSMSYPDERIPQLEAKIDEMKAHMNQNRAEMEEMRDKLKAAEKAAARAALGLDGDAASKRTIGELEEQVRELLSALQEAQDGVAELMVLRPKLAEAEKKLREAQQE